MEVMFHQKHNLYFYVNPSSGIWSLEKRTCQSRCTLAWTWIFLPVLPVDLGHLHLTEMSRFQDMIAWIDAAYSAYLPGSCGILLSEVSVNRGQEMEDQNFRRGSIFFTFSATSGRLSAAQWMTPVIQNYNLKPDGHKDLITIRPVCFQERNHFIPVCKINLDEFIIGSWICKAFDIVVMLEGIEYCSA